MAGCKVGNIARFIKGNLDHGKIVHVDAPATGRLYPTKKAWRITSLSGPLHAWDGSAYRLTQPGMLIIAYDDELEPLPGLPVKDRVDDEVVA